jgi:anion-transporting  ArsA/GET3 family ATPase
MVEGHGPRALRRPDVVILDAPATGHGVSWLAAPQLVADVVKSGPIGHMAELIADFLGDPERVGMVVVTTAEEMPVEESRELIQALRRRFDRQPDAVVANALYPAPKIDRDDDPTAELWRRRHAINTAQLERLGAFWAGPLAEVPLMPIDPGPKLVGAIARRIADQLRSA